MAAGPSWSFFFLNSLIFFFVFLTTGQAIMFTLKVNKLINKAKAEGFFWQCFTFSQHSAQSKSHLWKIHPARCTDPQKIHPFQPPPHTTRQKQRKFTPFPKSKPKPQKRRKRFIRKRSRSAEQIGIIFISNCSSQQVWLSPPTTDKIKVKNPTKPANCPKNRS